MLNAVRNELQKIFIHKRNYVILVGHLLFMFLCYLGFKLTPELHMKQRVMSGSAFEIDNFTKMLDGLFFARVALYPTFLALMPTAICVIAGEIISGETQEGSLRLYLARSRSRTQVLLSKIIAVYLVNLLYCLYFAAISIALGIYFFGANPTQLVLGSNQVIGSDFTLMSFGQALGRHFIVVIYFSFSLMSLASLAIFFSALFNRMTAASTASITFYFVCYIFSALPLAEVLKPYLLSEAMNNAFLLWMPEIAWNNLATNLAVLTLYIAGFSATALIVFNYKDIN